MQIHPFRTPLLVTASVVFVLSPIHRIALFFSNNQAKFMCGESLNEKRKDARAEKQLLMLIVFHARVLQVKASSLLVAVRPIRRAQKRRGKAESCVVPQPT